ncbi:MAG: acyltransferase [Lachnospiraceae bacterium]|nr:acyltransferase [Hungatella sp.]MCI8815147.1 acyltransferase [Lachnospiraceae bacterium]
MLIGRVNVNHEKRCLSILFGLKKYRVKSIGNNVRICSPGYLSCTENLIIGDNVFIGRDFYIEAQSKIEIGSGTMIGPKCTFISGSHCYDSYDLRAVPYDNRMKDLPIIIGQNVWIAANVTISPGTVIGEGAVIGSGTTVYGTIPAYSVVVNSGYKILKERNIEKYKELTERNAIYSVLYAGKGFEYFDK